MVAAALLAVRAATGLGLALSLTGGWQGFVQAVIGALMIYPIYGIGRRLYEKRVGLLGAWLFAFWLPSAYLTQWVSKEPWEMLFLIPLTWLSLAQWQEPRWHRFVSAILVFVLAVFVRGNMLPFLGMLCVSAIPLFGWRKTLSLAAIGYTALFLALLPWAARNQRVVSVPVFLKGDFYFAVFGGFCQYEPKYFAISPENHPRVRANGKVARTYDNFDVECKPITLQILRDRPLWYAGTVVRRFFWTLFHPLDWGQVHTAASRRSYQDFHQVTGQGRLAYLRDSPGYVLLKTLQRLWEISLVPGALLALWLRHRDWRAWLIIATCYFTFALSYAPIRIEARYIAPHTWSLLLLAAVALTALADRWRGAQPPTTPAGRAAI